MLRFQNWNATEDVGEKGQLKLHFLSKQNRPMINIVIVQ